MASSRYLGRGGRPRRDSMVNEKILDSGLRLLAEYGYERASMRAIRRHSGVSWDAIYARYESRDELLLEAFESGMRVRRVEITGDTERDLTSMVSVMVEHVFEGLALGLLSAVLLEESRRPGLLSAFRRQVVRPRRDRIRGILERAEGRGELRGSLDLDVVVDVLWGSAFARYVSGSGKREGLARDAVGIVLDGARRIL